MKDKPTICQKSSSLVGLKMRVSKGRHEAPAFVHNHQNCFISSKEKDDDDQCTYKPKINKKSKSLIENKVLANLKR